VGFSFDYIEKNVPGRSGKTVSSTATEKAQEERGIFECFAQVAGLVVRPESITQPDPPDILCEIDRLGQVGFELVQLDDQLELQRLKYLGRGPEFWEDTPRQRIALRFTLRRSLMTAARGRQRLRPVNDHAP